MKKQSEMDASCWRKGKTLDASNAEVSSVSEDGAGGGTRTHTMSPSADFETMPAEDQQLPVKWNGSDLCRITGKGSVYYRREDKLMVQEDALVKANAVLQ